MLNFTVGPVMSDEIVLEIGSNQVPYFRTPEFSDLMFENEKLMKKFTYAPEGSRAVFITGSGTASMEATVMNVFDKNDNVLIVNGGGFGNRFVELCQLHDIKYTEILIPLGETLTKETLDKYDGKDFTAFIVNIHETSIGLYYDLDLISEFSKKNDLFLVVDAISSFLADPINMEKQGVNVLITGSQKALACPPGISVIVLDKRAISRVNNISCKCMYFDLKDALKNGERGQTPFTPVVGILIQINARLKEIDKNGGVGNEIKRIANLASDFRLKIKDLPFDVCSVDLSNAVTPLHPLTARASDIFNILKDEYQIWVCPNGGDLEDTLFRVGHIGALTTKDNDTLINALKDLEKRGII